MADEPVIEPTATPTATSAETTATPISDATPSAETTEQSTTAATDDEPVGLSTAKAEGDEAKTEDEPNELFGAPAEDAVYEITGLPEGMTIDAAALEAASPVFRELNLSPAGASKVAAIYAEKVLPGVVEQTTQRVNEAMQAAVLDERKRMEGETRALVKADGKDADGVALKTATGDDITFDGNDMKKVMAIAARGIDRVMPAGFREMLAETGLEFDPRMMAGMYAIGKLTGEDTDMDRSTTTKAKRDADLFYE